MGQLEDPVGQAALDEEQRVHKDFQVVKVRETYENLVLKVLSSLADTDDYSLDLFLLLLL